MGVDFGYEDDGEKMKDFDHRIKQCDQIEDEDEQNRQISLYEMHKQRAEAHYKEAKKFLRKYYLINQNIALIPLTLRNARIWMMVMS